MSIIKPKNCIEIKKAIIAILLATLTLAACTKEDTTKWIDGTSWKYSYRNDEGFKEECYLSLRNNGGEASYYYGFPPSYGYAYTDLAGDSCIAARGMCSILFASYKY